MKIHKTRKRLVYTERAGGSIPSPPTRKIYPPSKRLPPLPIGERAGERGCNLYLFVIQQRLCGESPSLPLPPTREREENRPTHYSPLTTHHSPLTPPHIARTNEGGIFKSKGFTPKAFWCMNNVHERCRCSSAGRATHS